MKIVLFLKVNFMNVKKKFLNIFPSMCNTSEATGKIHNKIFRFILYIK